MNANSFTLALSLLSTFALLNYSQTASGQLAPCCASAVPHTAPALNTTSVRSLDICAQGDVLHLLLGLQFPDEPARNGLYYQRYHEESKEWSKPTRIDGGMPSPHLMQRGQDYRIAAHGSELMAIWITPGSGFGNRGPLVSALSTDYGLTWQYAGNPADTGSDDDHGFIALSADPQGVFHSVWLGKVPPTPPSPGTPITDSLPPGLNLSVVACRFSAQFLAMAVPPGLARLLPAPDRESIPTRVSSRLTVPCTYSGRMTTAVA